MEPNAGFIHRNNHDGTIDSICLCCFLTVASATEHFALIADELHHSCHPLTTLAALANNYLQTSR